MKKFCIDQDVQAEELNYELDELCNMAEGGAL